jgi:hypothetical protein
VVCLRLVFFLVDDREVSRGRVLIQSRAAEDIEVDVTRSSPFLGHRVCFRIQNIGDTWLQR